MKVRRMRLIDADKMITDLKAMEQVYNAIALDGMIRGIERQPTVDAVEVTRCKDCLNGWPLTETARVFAHQHGIREDSLLCVLGRGYAMCGYSFVLSDGYCSDGVSADDGGAKEENHD